MGLHNRDYARDSSGGGSFFKSGGGGYGGFTSDRGGVVKKIIIATIAVFVLQLVTQRPVTDADGNPVVVHDSRGRKTTLTTDAVSDWCAVRYEQTVKQGQVWRLLTYAFCHSRGSLFHIAFNLFILWWVGREIESLYGSKEFLWFYLVGAFFAGAFYVLFGVVLRSISNQPFGYMLGASGAVNACLMLYGLHYPRRKIYIMGVLGIEMRYFIAFALFIDVYPLAFELLGVAAPDLVGANVAHSCHLGGFAFGWFYFKRQIRLSSLINGVGFGQIKSKVKAKKSSLRIFSPAEEPKPKRSEVSGEEVDAILEKISRDGESSLTDREREILKQASQQYKAR